MSRERAPGLDLLRVCAIGLVLLHHFRHLPGAPEELRWFALRADVGVDLFFALSGWLVGGQLWRERARTGGLRMWRFWRRRWWRTVPAYLVVLALLALLGRVRGADVPAMLVFLQNYLAPHAWLTSWSLCIEEQFYLALPIVVWVGAELAHRRPRVAVSLAVLAAVASPAGRWFAFEAMRQGSYDGFLENFYGRTHLRLEGLVFGVVAAWGAVHKPERWPRRTGLLALAGLGLLGLTWLPALSGRTSASVERMLFFHAVPGFVLASAGTVLLLPAALAWRAAEWLGRLLASLADLAYPLYLTHELARDGILHLLGGRTIPFGGWLTLSLAASLGIAVFLRAVVEWPMLALRDRWERVDPVV